MRNKLDEIIYMIYGDQKEYQFDCAIRCANFLKVLVDGRNSVQEIVVFLETSTTEKIIDK